MSINPEHWHPNKGNCLKRKVSQMDKFQEFINNIHGTERQASVAPTGTTGLAHFEYCTQCEPVQCDCMSRDC